MPLKNASLALLVAETQANQSQHSLRLWTTEPEDFVAGENVGKSLPRNPEEREYVCLWLPGSNLQGDKLGPE